MLAIVYGVPFLINLLIVILVVAVFLFGLAWVVNQMAPPQPFRMLIWGIVAIVLLIAMLRFFGVGI